MENAQAPNIRRDVTSCNQYVGDVTIRRYYEDGAFLRADIYKAGWRSAVVRTDRGISNAVARLSSR